jgi:hypothetical protein
MYLLPAVHVAEEREVRTVFWWGNLRGKRKLERLRQKWKDNIKTNFQRMGRGEWPRLIWLWIDRMRTFVNAVMNFRLP